MSIISNLPTTTTFFEYVGIAGLERMNSQIVAWIFSNENCILDEKERVELLNHLFPTTRPSTTINHVLTEEKYVDLVIETEPRNVVVENKMKIDEHSGQLKKYEDQMDEEQKEKSDTYFLTWVGDTGKSSDSWRPVTYGTLYKKLNKLLERKVKNNQLVNQNTYDYLLLKGYAENLRRMEEVKELFVKDHTSFPEVFYEGGLHKSKKLKRGGVEPREGEEPEVYCGRSFIARCNLETTLQRLFYNEMFKDVQERVPEVIGYNIAESHGTALVDLGSNEKIAHNNDTYLFGIQFQGNSVKITFQLENSWRQKEKILPFLEEFGRLGKEGGRNYAKLNKPRSNGYASVSKKLVEEGSWFSLSKNELRPLFTKEIVDGFAAIKEIAPALQDYTVNHLMEKKE